MAERTAAAAGICRAVVVGSVRRRLDYFRALADGVALLRLDYVRLYYISGRGRGDEHGEPVVSADSAARQRDRIYMKFNVVIFVEKQNITPKNLY